MKKGTIYRNLCAGNETYFVYDGKAISGRAEASKVSGYSITNINGEWHFEKAQYYTHSLKDSEQFPVVGCIDIPKLITDKILSVVMSHPSNDPLAPCDVCRFYPPSSGDGKPCCICPAEGKGE